MKKAIAALLSLLLISVLTVSAFADIAPLPDEEYDRIFGTGDIVIEPDPDAEKETEEDPSEDSGKDAEETENNTKDPADVVEEKTSGPSTALIVTMAAAVAVIAGAVLVRTVGMKKEGETK